MGSDNGDVSEIKLLHNEFNKLKLQLAYLKGGVAVGALLLLVFFGIEKATISGRVRAAVLEEVGPEVRDSVKKINEDAIAVETLLEALGTRHHEVEFVVGETFTLDQSPLPGTYTVVYSLGSKFEGATDIVVYSHGHPDHQPKEIWAAGSKLDGTHNPKVALQVLYGTQVKGSSNKDPALDEFSLTACVKASEGISAKTGTATWVWVGPK